jgi:hypothetical protein
MKMRSSHVVCPVGVTVLMSILTIAGLFAAPAAPADQIAQEIISIGERFNTKGGHGESFCWQAAYRLDGAMPGYLVTKDTEWLDDEVKTFTYRFRGHSIHRVMQSPPECGP